ncbi:hypothetical protein GCM10010182_54920 [Actinomadura cremea]|nr:hypothetical protein GCM10010182_54920 [Actinomadura cremea]
MKRSGSSKSRKGASIKGSAVQLLSVAVQAEHRGFPLVRGMLCGQVTLDKRVETTSLGYVRRSSAPPRPSRGGRDVRPGAIRDGSGPELEGTGSWELR